MGTSGSQIKLLPTRALSEDAAKYLSPWNTAECVSKMNVVAAPESHLGRTLLREYPAPHASGQLCKRPQARPAPTALWQAGAWTGQFAICPMCKGSHLLRAGLQLQLCPLLLS